MSAKCQKRKLERSVRRRRRGPVANHSLAEQGKSSAEELARRRVTSECARLGRSKRTSGVFEDMTPDSARASPFARIHRKFGVTLIMATWGQSDYQKLTFRPTPEKLRQA